MITVDQLQTATTSSAANASKFIDGISAALGHFEINTTQRMAAFLATVAIESAHLTAVEEGLYYSDPSRLAAIFPRVFASAIQAAPYAKNPSGLSQKLYAGFHGRGLIQLTWKSNYQACSDALGVDFVSSPSLLCQPEYAAKSAGWFWSTHGCNQLADAGDMLGVTRVVNGPALLALAERQNQYALALKSLG